jgi:uncharacterized protein
MTTADASSRERGGFVTSRYNFAVPTVETAVVFNALHGSAVRLGGARALAEALAEPGVLVGEEDLPPALFLELVRSRVLVSADTDELAIVAERFHRARADAAIVVTVTTTMDCNLGCYYCYEDRSGAALDGANGDVDALVALVSDTLARSGKRSLHVDWYGGEPLLNLAFLEEASLRLQALCAERGTTYRASIISNGTVWPEDVGGFVARHRIGHAQVTFDGLRANHDRRRHYRREHRTGDDRPSSFDRIVELLDRLPDHCRVDLRCNVDGGNADDFVELVRFARERGWFDRRYPVAIQPARLMKFSDHSSFMRDVALDLPAFEAVRQRIEAAAPAHVEVQNTCAPDGFPVPRTSVCAALARDSVVVGAEGALYRCGLQVGEASRQVGKLPRRRHLPVVEAAGDHAFWASFDPTRQPRCHACSFLPICWSGCPKNHLEGDTAAILEQGAYWRANLARLVATGLGLTLDGEVTYESAQQFPDGEPAPYANA